MALPVRLEVNPKGMDFAVHLTENSSSVVVGTVKLLVPLAVNTKGMGEEILFTPVSIAFNSLLVFCIRSDF